VRAKEILGIGVRHGFGSLIQQIDIPAGWQSRFFPENNTPRTIWQRIRDVCEELGPTTVKFAQILSARPDLIPSPLVFELKQLRSSVRPVPWELIKPIIEEELGGAIETFFNYYNPVPVASGSLAQVHRARLLKNDCEVAIKIQRPGISRAIESDLDILQWLAEKLDESVVRLKPFDLPSLIEETRRGIAQELNFTHEARNAQYFNTMNPEPATVFAPVPLLELTTDKLIVYEWVNGKPTHDVSLTKEEGKVLAKRGGRSIFHQIMIAGFFHGDPHSGNILITPDQRICFVDWGLAGQLTRRMRYFLADIFAGAAAQNPEKIVRAVKLMSDGSHRIDETRLEKDVSFILRKYPDFSTGSEAAGRLIIDLIYTFGQNGIHLSRDYALLGKAIISIEEAARGLDPHFDIRSIAKPYLEQLNWERHNPKNVTQVFYRELLSSLTQLHNLPLDIHRLIHRMENGELLLNFQLTGLERLRAALDRAAMHLVFGVIVGSLIIGSSLVIASGAGPQLWGLSALGLSGYGLASLITLALAGDAWRKH